MAEREPVAIVGVGGMGRETLDLLLACNAVAPRYDIVGFLDDNPAFHGQECCGYPVLGGLAWAGAHTEVGISIGIGENRVRALVHRKLRDLGCTRFPTVTHPTAILSSMAQLGDGCIVGAGVIVTCQVQIGDFVILNIGSTVSHDNRLDDFSMLDPGAHLAGDVTLGAGVEVGTGAAIIPRRTIGEGAFIGAGAAVIHDIPPHTVAAGVPAKVIREIAPELRFGMP